MNFQCLRGFGVVLFVAVGLGCSAPVAENCVKPLGTYKAEYYQLNGDCQPGYQPFLLKFDADDPNSKVTTERRFADTVTTETLLKGCEVGIKLSVSAEQTRALRSALNGNLAVMEDALHGTVERVDFMENGAVRCSALYEATYTRDGQLIGAAAR